MIAWLSWDESVVDEYSTLDTTSTAAASAVVGAIMIPLASVYKHHDCAGVFVICVWLWERSKVVWKGRFLPRIVGGFGI